MESARNEKIKQIMEVDNTVVGVQKRLMGSGIPDKLKKVESSKQWQNVSQREEGGGGSPGNNGLTVYLSLIHI